MLVFAGIVPHAPVLIPNIGQDNLNKLKKTVKALDVLEEELTQANPEVLIIISPHGEVFSDSFNINTNEQYVGKFDEFGDFETQVRVKPDLEFINKFQSQVQTKIPLVLSQPANLDHGTSIPLFYLTRQLKDVKIVPISVSMLSYEKHLAFGEELKEMIFKSGRRCAVIASGDLSHKLSMTAPAGFSAKAKEFDKKLIQLLKQKKIASIVEMDKDIIKEAEECGLRSFLILLGVIKNMKYEFEVLNYEAPFGVGYLVGQFNFD